MRSRGALVAGLLSMLLLSSAAVARAGEGADESTFHGIEESLTCQCGCGLTVHSCNHLQCGSALPLREEIRAQLAEGKDKGAILDYFKAKYGEKILSSPTTSGFNLVAWITPFVLVALGGVFVLLTVRRWGNRGGGDPGSGPKPEAPSTPKEYQKILERELEQFDR